MIKLVAFDLDGTLVHNSNTLSDASWAVIRELLDQGVAVSSMSGRNFERNQLPFVSDPEVADALFVGGYNGAMVFAPKHNGERQVMHEQRLPDDVFLGLIEYVKDRQMNFVYCRCDLDGKDVHEVYMTDRTTELSLKVAAMTDMVYDADVNLAQRLLDKDLATPPKIMLLPEDGRADETVNDLKKMYGDQIYMAWAVAGRIEVMHSEVNKGVAVASIARHLGLEMDEVMAVGDGNNDLPMLHAVGTGVIMANADAATLDAGEGLIRTDRVGDDGFANAVRRYVLDA